MYPKPRETHSAEGPGSGAWPSASHLAATWIPIFAGMKEGAAPTVPPVVLPAVRLVVMPNTLPHIPIDKPNGTVTIAADWGGNPIGF